MTYNVDLSRYHNSLSRKHQIERMVWSVVWGVFARPIPRSMFSGWKRFLLRAFGARLAGSSNVYSGAKIYYPRNLVMGENACLADDVNCYNVAPIVLEDNVTVSQGAYLCTASHDIMDIKHPLIVKPITIEKGAWVAAEAFVGMGVTIHEGAVVGARAAVFKDVDAWTVVGGNPAKFIKKRELRG